LSNLDESVEPSIDDFINKFGGWTESFWFFNHTVELRYDVKNHEYLLVTEDGLEQLPSVTHICHLLDKSQVLMPWATKCMYQEILEKVTNLDGTVVVSWTEFEKIVKEAKTAHKRQLEKAGDVGSQAHNWIESYSKSLIDDAAAATQLIIDNTPEDMKAKSACIAFLDWSVKHNVRPICAERKVFSLKYRYAGTMDGTCLIDSCDNPECCPKEFKDHLAIIDYKTSNYLYDEFVLQVASYKQAYQEETGEQIEDCFLIKLNKDDAEFTVWHMGPETFEDDWAAFKSLLDAYRAMQIVTERMTEQKEEHRVWKKRQKEAEKSEIYKVACPKSGTYKGVRKTKCNGTQESCQACAKKYEETQKARLESLVLKNTVDKPEEV
jgi:hypothetical protein